MAKPEKYDFSGWATRNDIRCSDGRTIRRGAFAEQDGATVPLVWNHNHVDADNVLGHAILENRDQGVYAYCFFNDTKQGNNAKELVTHGDICSLSIFANQLKQNGGDVIHGAIREVSLVLAGANPGAKIENIMAHGDNSEEEAIIYNDSDEINLAHSEEKEKMEEENKEKTVKDVIDSMTEEQRNVMYALIGEAIESTKNESDDDQSNEEENQMKHNAFENEDQTKKEETETLSHSEFMEIVSEAKRKGSMKDAFLDHNITEIPYLAHSITNVGNLFPEAKAVSRVPEVVDRDQTWVGNVMASVKHTPFSRVKSFYANITADEARAKGYVKGAKKVEEVITALKRTTDPQTVYKLQKMDRDDIIDITDFDVVAWLKGEMRGKLDEEIARAILIGDGRSSSSADKVDPLKIRPVYQDDTTYTIKRILTRDAKADDSAFAKAFIKDVVKSRKEYKGSGNPTLYTTEDMLTSMLLIEDTTGRVIYDTIEKLKTALRVRDIVTVPVMENVGREDTSAHKKWNLLGVLVNLSDYNVGADKGGSVNMFDDFDINYNKYEYLIETRCSGALVKPYSAITFEEEISTASNAGK
ncbi:MAG: HK97 family phage prohead protease [Lactobacillus johnsonii]|nr:HK97 family phage prohead protease [Lactobacillus johnsonii]